MSEPAPNLLEEKPRPGLAPTCGELLGLGPREAERLQAELSSGTPAPVALRQAGAPEPIVRFVEQSAPPDLALALDGLARAWSRAEARRQGLRSLAVYPLLLAVVAPLVAFLVLWGVRPAASLVAGAEGAMPAPALPLPWLALGACAGGVVALLLLAGSLLGRVPRIPFRRERLTHERALLLDAAQVAVKAGVELATALTAAAGLALTPELKRNVAELADSLRRGAPAGGDELLGDVGAALFRTTVAHGAGPSTLEALAALEEARAESGKPGLTMKAELIALALGGLAIGGAGLSLVQLYGRSFW